MAEDNGDADGFNKNCNAYSNMHSSRGEGRGADTVRPTPTGDEGIQEIK